MKQATICTSANHVENLAQHKEKWHQRSHVKTMLHVLLSWKKWYMKGDKIKHILPKLFFTHDLQKNGDINVQQVCSRENLEDLATNPLTRKTFEQLVNKIELPGKVFNEIGDNVLKNDVLFSFTRFLSHMIFSNKVLTRYIFKLMGIQGRVLWIIFCGCHYLPLSLFVYIFICIYLL